MSDTNNKRIARNTLFLYVRMLLVMAVSLYTSRIILAALGVTDFGIYNVVGGVVAFLGFLNSSMSNAVQRFLSFELGRNDGAKTNHVFCSALIAHFSIAVFIVIVLELVGSWFISNQLNIPPNRLCAAKWVFQCSVITSFFSILQVPYNAIIIAKERMGVYAYLSILEVLFKLVIVYFLLIISYDRLITYAVLHAIVTIGVLQFYRIYCSKKFIEAKFRLVRDYSTLKEIGSFAVWNLIGEFAWSVTNQGVSFVINVFVGPVVNAAQGVSVQVNTAVMRFVSNFQTALNPQIIKSYSSSALEDMSKLISRGSRLSFFLLLLLSLPLIFEMDYVLHLWLKEVPDYAREFCQMMLICSLVMTATNLLVTIIRATGNIREYQFVTAILLLFNFPLSWFVLKIGMPPYTVIISLTLVQIINGCIRLYYVKKLVNYPIRSFVCFDLAKMIVVLLISSTPFIILKQFCMQGTYRFVLSVLFTGMVVILSSYMFGLERKEKIEIYNAFVRKWNHFRK